MGRPGVFLFLRKAGDNLRIDPAKMMTLLVKQDRNMTDLAAACGLSRQTIYSVKAGRRCGDSTAAKIAKSLGVTVKDLV